MSNYRNRLPNYDLLRIISTFAVIIIHANWIYLESIYNQPALNRIWVILSLINIITRFSVPCFVMLSGAFVLQNNNNSYIKQFYIKSAKKIFLPAFIFLVLLSFVQIAINIINNNKIYQSFGGILRGDFYNLWYIYMIFGLYLMVPFIIQLKRCISFTQYKILAIIMIIWAIISQATSNQKLAYSIGVCFSFLGYFLLGDVIKTEIDNGWNPKKVVLILLCFVSIALSLITRYFGYNYYVSDAYINFFSPTIVLYSLCVFCFFGRLRCKYDYSRISDKTFEIYLAHTLVLRCMEKYIIINNINQIFNILILVAVTSLISFLIAVIFKYFYRKIVTKH